MIETHAHIYSDQFKEDIDEVIDKAKESGVERIYMPNIDSGSIDAMLEMEHLYPGYCIPMIGLHPCSVKADFEKELYIVEDWLSKRDFVAIGEMGTDLYWDKTLFEQQKEAFKIQSDLAVRYEKPIVIHCRESMEETITLLESYRNTSLFGIVHCFSGSEEQARRIIDLGFKLGIGGVATFKNGGLEPVMQNISLHEMVLETDSPYLAPVPYRGKRNEPAYIRQVAQKIADERNIDISEVIEATTDTAMCIFENNK
ncbi:TatD DNase family protein [Reichenbachiella agariperforans]|uniref:TatD DNase family protein n=1 Tax=Reichenbachiella agariperforans TaxID=156994 RepID=A0A1M6LCU4_REIAG|nr:TatD family hydrolase [Reichenbachiella agariperforans]SHJ69023.1 TatD DNase family protein [Reichenbachiella agariperforans]